MILLTGSTGYIGSEIISIFEKQKTKYIALDNLSYSNKKNIINKKNFYKLDYSSKIVSKLIKKFSVKSVVHCGAFSYVIDAEENKKKYYKNNVLKTKKFISICKKEGVKNFIFLSSSNVYKELNKNYNEKDPAKPKNFYGKNKIIIEKFLKKKNFNSLIILRLFNVIGLSKKFYIYRFLKNDYQRIFFKFVYGIKKVSINYTKVNDKIVFPKRDFIDVRDVSSVVNLLLRKLNTKKINETFNVATGKPKSLIELYKNFSKTKNFKLKKMSKKELIETSGNVLKLKKFLKWTPKYNFKSSIKSIKKFAKY
tara:strand:+ start:5400 stop:6326 length:927 start_codon:yes stop_codon:yes gene_type:complete